MIHTDFEKGFICAEVMSFKDLEEAGGDEAKVKAAGKLMQKVCDLNDNAIEDCSTQTGRLRGGTTSSKMALSLTSSLTTKYVLFRLHHDSLSPALVVTGM